MNPSAEPTFETATQWWPEMPNKWAPVGWKDHLVRFNVLWSGAILAKPNLNRRTSQYEGLGAQFTIVPDCARVVSANPPGLDCVMQAFRNIATLIVGITGSAALLMFVYGGFTMIASRGAEAEVKKVSEKLGFDYSNLTFKKSSIII